MVCLCPSFLSFLFKWRILTCFMLPAYSVIIIHCKSLDNFILQLYISNGALTIRTELLFLGK